MDSSNKEIVKFITPFPMTESQKNMVKSKLSRIGNIDQMIFQEEVDPSLIGGIIIIFGEMLIDCSLRTQLDKMKEGMI
ncbi:MAG TPA: F0F1 ATP synthase subunit delta [Atribacter sp.]|jgi:F0F1-type ATP synthase delta subunit|uniref:F0F1 ATP synthase subunit delta n=2 Tax=Atribacter TaxID=2847777 RepID=A0A1V5T135_9BACT|nr:F0F1 ATP synthase subunit delta [Atribacter sp.]MDI9593816.1 F0F1 ATP synthase subunit delta [Atribacterota bacterium]OQA60131.1 MAG: F0F1 ATP synthase subunit delta [Candidatus Atribacteria bacterium ADurb.Bin276]HHT09055.1 F0F1 ATP synthase subunit delta [Candidatus Atribacteria bacterium]HQK83212.1 F0F1 ATP synthase subunit delta [Atribacter sp.]